MHTRLTPRGRVLRLLLFKLLVVVTTTVTVGRGAVIAERSVARTMSDWFRPTTRARPPVMAATRQPIPLIPNPINLPPPHIGRSTPLVSESPHFSFAPPPVHRVQSSAVAPIDPRFPLPVDPAFQNDSEQSIAGPPYIESHPQSPAVKAPQHHEKPSSTGSSGKHTDSPPAHHAAGHDKDGSHSEGSHQKSGKK